MNISFCFVVETFGIFIFLIGIGIPIHSMTPIYLIDFLPQILALVGADWLLGVV